MKQARMRVNTADGTQHNHAYYESWRASVLDYAFYQCRYLGGIRSEDGYYQYLGQSYAEDGGYVTKLRALIRKNDLKSKF
jgi:flagellum-specific peptidoglycan hydrolase FlgJ